MTGLSLEAITTFAVRIIRPDSRTTQMLVLKENSDQLVIVVLYGCVYLRAPKDLHSSTVTMLLLGLTWAYSGGFIGSTLSAISPLLLFKPKHFKKVPGHIPPRTLPGTISPFDQLYHRPK